MEDYLEQVMDLISQVVWELEDDEATDFIQSIENELKSKYPCK